MSRTAAPSMSLHGVDPYGNRCTWTIGEPAWGPGSPTGLEVGTSALVMGGEIVLKLRRPTREPARLEIVDRALDAEVRTGVRIARRYAPDGSTGDRPRGLSVLLGYNDDVAEPFAVLAPYAGTAARDVVPRALIGEQAKRDFAADLMTAVGQLAQIDVVHGALGLDALRFESSPSGGGPTVQIVDFEHAVLAGERRPDGTLAHPGDDVLAAGRLLAVAFAGARDDPGAEVASVQWLAAALEDVFDPDPARRPSALDIVARLRTGARVARPKDQGGRLDTGRRRFDELRGRLPDPRPDPAPTVPPQVAPRSADAARSRGGGLPTLLVWTVLVLAVGGGLVLVALAALAGS